MCIVKCIGELDTTNVNAIVEHLETALAGYDEDTLFALVQSALEVLENLHEHADVHQVLLSVLYDPEYVGVQIDVDQPLDEQEVIPKTFPTLPAPNALRGRGKYIISKLVDSFKMNTDGQHSQLVLQRSLA